MKILYITPSFHHPRVRGSNRHYHVIKELAKRHAITWLTLQRAPIPMDAMQEMVANTERLFTFPVKRTTASNGHSPLRRLAEMSGPLAQQAAVRASVQRMRTELRRLVEQDLYDVVLFHGKDCYRAIDNWRETPVVVDFCDATSLRIHHKMRYVSRIHALLLGLRYLQVRRLEQNLVRNTPHLAFISARDRDAILGPAGRAEVIPNGIDLAYWTRRMRESRPHCLIFTGVMSYAPNEDAALRLIDAILPRLRGKVPNLEIVIAGREPTPKLLKRAEPHPEVTVTGYVEDLRDYLEQATLFVAPLRYASGMQNKLQEALAMAVPVVTTSIAADGLRIDGGGTPPVQVADDDDLFAQRVLDLLRNPGRRAHQAEDGRRYAEQHFSWKRSAEQFERMCYDAVMAGRAGHTTPEPAAAQTTVRPRTRS